MTFNSASAPFRRSTCWVRLLLHRQHIMIMEGSHRFRWIPLPPKKLMAPPLSLFLLYLLPTTRCCPAHTTVHGLNLLFSEIHSLFLPHTLSRSCSIYHYTLLSCTHNRTWALIYSKIHSLFLPHKSHYTVWHQPFYSFSDPYISLSSRKHCTGGVRRFYQLVQNRIAGPMSARPTFPPAKQPSRQCFGIILPP